MKSFLLIFFIIISWGLWGFFSKLAIQKIGFQASLWNAIALLLIVVTFLVISNQLFPIKNDFQGIIFAICAGIFSGIASILFYVILGKKPVGALVAVTALYPLITLILSMLFLRESLTFSKAIGFVLAIGALMLINL